MADDGHTINVGPVTVRPDTVSIRAWWDDQAATLNTPTPHWSIPVLCDEIDRLRAEMARLAAENTALMGDARL